MSEVLSLYVKGTPIPQGSKKHVGNGVMIESAKGLRSWRKTIAAQVGTVWKHQSLDGPVRLSLVFVMPRPKATPKSRTPPAIRRPDLDKLTRAVFDALTTAQVITDDSRIVELSASKRLSLLCEEPGVLISVMALSG